MNEIFCFCNKIQCFHLEQNSMLLIQLCFISRKRKLNLLLCHYLSWPSFNTMVINLKF